MIPTISPAALTRDELESRRRMAHKLFDQGLHHKDIKKMLGVSRQTARLWFRKYRQQPDWYKSGKRTGRRVRMHPAQQQMLVNLWQQLQAQHKRPTHAEFAQLYYKASGVFYDPDHMGRILRKLGLVR